jgi:hypothetical protein
MEYSNYNNFTNYDTLRRNFRIGVHNWSERAHHHRALSGDGVEIREVNTMNGSRITQDTDDRQFLNSGRTANWSLGTGLEGVRQFRMNVTTLSLHNDSSVDTQGEYQTSNYFRVNVTMDGGPGRRIYIYRNSAGDRALVRVGGPSGLSPPCSVAANDNDRVTLHLSNGLIGKDHCEQLTFLDEPRTPFAINYTNGDAIEGSYELFVDEGFGNLSDGDFSGTHPTLERAIYSATIDVNYTTESAQLRGNRTATPDRRRPIDAGSPFTFSIPTGDKVTFKNGGNIRVLNKSGSSENYNGPNNPRGIGPTAVSIDADSEDETPFSRQNNDLRVAGGTRLSRDSTPEWTTLAVGFWKSGGASIFYAGGDTANGEIRQRNASGGDTVFTPPNGVKAVAGIDNMTAGLPEEIVYLNDDDEIMYYDGTSATFTGITLPPASYSNSPPIGTPADFNDNGTARVPFVNTNGRVTLATHDGATRTLTSTGNATAAPMASLDWDADGELDIIYIDSNDDLRVIYNVSGTNVNRPVNNSAGSPITDVDNDVGVR